MKLPALWTQIKVPGAVNVGTEIVTYADSQERELWKEKVVWLKRKRKDWKEMKHFLSILGLHLLLSGCGWLYSIGDSATNDFDLSKSGMAVPEFEFTNQFDEQYGSEDLKGQFWLAKMVFTNCPTVCPIMTPNMISLQDAMIDEGIEMKFISFTVDPERDTPEHLRKYGQNIGAKEGYWYFLTGYAFEDFQDFSIEAFNSPVENLEDSEDILHTTRFFLVDPEGQVIRGYDGMITDQTEVIEDLIATVNE